MALEPFYRLCEAAELLGVSEPWLRDQLRRRRFGGMKVAGRWRMRESQLDEALEIMSTHAAPPDAPPVSGLAKQSRLRRSMMLAHEVDAARRGNTGAS